MRAAPPPIDRLPPWDGRGRLRAVIGAARGTRARLEYRPALGAFELHHLPPPGVRPDRRQGRLGDRSGGAGARFARACPLARQGTCLPRAVKG